MRELCFTQFLVLEHNAPKHKLGTILGAETRLHRKINLSHITTLFARQVAMFQEFNVVNSALRFGNGSFLELPSADGNIYLKLEREPLKIRRSLP